MPALLTRTSIVPKLAVGGGRERLHLLPVADVAGDAASARRPVSRLTSSAVASQLGSLRLATTTSAPAWAKARTIARPRPRLPPVTTATLP